MVEVGELSGALVFGFSRSVSRELMWGNQYLSEGKEEGLKMREHWMRKDVLGTEELAHWAEQLPPEPGPKWKAAVCAHVRTPVRAEQRFLAGPPPLR